MANVEEQITTTLAPYQSEALPDVVHITCRTEYIEVGESLKFLKARQKEVDTARKDLTDPIRLSLERSRAFFAPVLDRYAKREAELKRAMVTYDREQEVERRRIEAELRDTAREAAVAATKEAAALRKQGKVEQAEAVIDSIPSVPVVIADKVKIPGIVQRGVWKAEVQSLAEFVLWCIDNDSIDAYLLPNLPALNVMARAMGDAAKVPGVRFVEETNVAVRP